MRWLHKRRWIKLGSISINFVIFSFFRKQKNFLYASVLFFIFFFFFDSMHVLIVLQFCFIWDFICYRNDYRSKVCFLFEFLVTLSSLCFCCNIAKDNFIVDKFLTIKKLDFFTKNFKENVSKIFWGCLLLPVWNAIINMG